MSEPHNIDMYTLFVSFACFVIELLKKYCKIGSHFDMQIRRLKLQNFAWEPCFSDSAPLNYVKWPGSQLLPPNAPNILIEGLFSEMCLV